MFPFQALDEWNNGAPKNTSSSNKKLQIRAQGSSACLLKNIHMLGKDRSGMGGRQQEESHSWQWFVHYIAGTRQHELCWSGVVGCLISPMTQWEKGHINAQRTESQAKASVHRERTQRHTRNTKRKVINLPPEAYKLYFLLLPSQFRRHRETHLPSRGYWIKMCKPTPTHTQCFQTLLYLRITWESC